MKVSDTSAEASAFELKGSVLTVMVLHLRQTDPNLLYPQLKKKLGPARSFFNNAPVLIDLKAVAEEEQPALDFLVLGTFLRGLGLVPVGVRGCTDIVTDRALAAGLGLLPVAKTEKTVPQPELDIPVTEPELPPQPSVAEPPEAAQPTPIQAATMIVTQPVRSGQQVVAEHGDLVVLSSVNAGAEVIASGNIHVYGALRGRAMAGVHGDSTARIFSLQCNPELVAVADAYVVNDLLNRAVINQSVIISHSQGGLRFEILGTFSPYHG
jgi:septum site-determining protein MinC